MDVSIYADVLVYNYVGLFILFKCIRVIVFVYTYMCLETDVIVLENGNIFHNHWSMKPSSQTCIH